MKGFLCYCLFFRFSSLDGNCQSRNNHCIDCIVLMMVREVPDLAHSLLVDPDLRREKHLHVFDRFLSHWRKCVAESRKQHMFWQHYQKGSASVQSHTLVSIAIKRGC